MKAFTAARTPTVGFGCPKTDWPHHFSIPISRDRRAPVDLTEDYGMGLDGPRFVECVARPTRNALADTLAGELNIRLKAANMAPGRWMVGENRMDRTLGKEVELLLMAVIDQDAEALPAVVANWRELTPEERWWLHGKASRSGAWREAVRFRLADRPAD